MASHPASVPTRPHASESAGGAFWMFAAIVLGFTAAAVGLAAFLMWLDARGEETQSAATPAVASARTASAWPTLVGRGSMFGLPKSQWGAV